jgi:hypothetical protein
MMAASPAQEVSLGKVFLEEVKVNLDKVFLEDFLVAFNVGQFPSTLVLTLSCVDTSHSIGWILRVGKQIQRLSASPSPSLNPS